MIRVGRSAHTMTSTTPSGAPVELTAERWWAAMAGGHRGVAVSYHRPRSVGVLGTEVAIRDPVGTVRLLALVAVLTATLLRRLRR